MPLHELLIDYLRLKELLLVVDNCEHLVEACAQLIEQLLHACPRLKIIASSREALGIAGETVYRVPSLALPDEADPDPAGAGAVRIGAALRRARLRRQSQLQPDGSATPAPSRRSAAAWTASRSPSSSPPRGSPLFSAEQVAARLDDRFRLLTGGSRTALPRQQTLRALIDWSYDLLSEPERSLFRRFSVFAGGCTYDAIEKRLRAAGCAQPAHAAGQQVAGGGGRRKRRSLAIACSRPCVSMPRDKLVELGEAEQARAAHFEFFMRLVRDGRRKARHGRGAPVGAPTGCRIRQPASRIRMGHGESPRATLRSFRRFVRYWMRRGHEEEGRRFIAAIGERAEKTAGPRRRCRARMAGAVGHAWNSGAMLAYSQGDNARGIPLARACRGACPDAPETSSAGPGARFLGSSTLFLGPLR